MRATPSQAPRNINQRGRLQLLQPVIISAEAAVAEDETLTMADLTQFSEFLAAEMNFKPFSATFEPAGWYREQVGPDLCSEGQGELLRRMTIKRCNEGARAAAEELEAKAPGMGQLPVSWMKSHAEMIDAFVLIAILIFLFGLCPLLAGHGR